MQYNIIFISCQEVTVHSLTRSNRLIVYAKMAISYYILSDISHPNEKYLVSSSCKSISPPFAKLTVCIAVLPAFYSIAARRSLCTTYFYYPITAGSRQLRQCSGGVFAAGEKIIFRGVIQGQDIVRYHHIGIKY